MRVERRNSRKLWSVQAFRPPHLSLLSSVARTMSPFAEDVPEDLEMSHNSGFSARSLSEDAW
jgi:hypothetical protein